MQYCVYKTDCNLYMHDKMFAKYVSFDVLCRPIAGNVNFCPSAFTTGSSSDIFATAKHEVIHALVRNSLEREEDMYA